MKAVKLITSMVAMAALAAGLAAPTAALADRGDWDHRGHWEHRHHDHWRHAPRVVYPYYYAPPVVRYYRPPVVVYPAPAYAAPYPVYPGGQFTFSFSAPF